MIFTDFESPTNRLDIRKLHSSLQYTPYLLLSFFNFFVISTQKNTLSLQISNLQLNWTLINLYCLNLSLLTVFQLFLFCHFHNFSPRWHFFQLIFSQILTKKNTTLISKTQNNNTNSIQTPLTAHSKASLLSFDFLCVAIFMITSLNEFFSANFFVKSTQNFESRLSKTLLIITLTYLRELLLPSLRLSLRLVPIIVLLLLLELDLLFFFE